MRLTDVVLRQGHLSEDALAEAIYTGERPSHLDHCGLCAERALELSRWLDEVKILAVEAADEVFPPEKLAAQHAQILRRLEQADEPARVITFPAVSAPAQPETRIRRVAPAWVGVAAAAGIVIGVIGGQATARLNQPAGVQNPAGVQIAAPAPASTDGIDGLEGIVSQPASETQQPQNASFMELNLEGYTPEMLQGIDEMIPKLVPSRYTVASAR